MGMQVLIMNREFIKIMVHAAKLPCLLICGWLLATVLLSTSLWATHPVSIVEAHIYVNQGRTTVRLTCFAEDLELLQGIEPGDDGFYDSAEIEEATEDHAEYLSEKIIIRDINGEQLPASVTNITGVEIPDGGIKAGTLMQYTMAFELEINHPRRPEFLTLEQQMVAEGALLPSELKALVKQSGAENSYLKMLKPGMPETFRFDWENPPLSPEASQQEWDTWFDSQEEQVLGIVSYSSVYSFIYITGSEVRHEVLIPLATLATMIELERADPAFLSVEEQADAGKKIEAFFRVGNPVSIDGVTVKPLFDRVDFYGLDLRDFAQQTDKRKVSMASGRVGVIMRYPAKTPPAAVTVEWTKFSDSIRSVDAVVFAYKEAHKASFSTFLENNLYRWEAADAAPLPAITNVDLADPRYFAASPTFGLPVLTLVMLLAALMLFPFSFKSLKVLIMAWGLVAVGVMASQNTVVQLPSPFEPAGTIHVEEETAGRVFDQLHTNLFRAFDYSQEEDVYDALAVSVHGDLLRKLYLQISNSLRIEQEGGAIAHIEQVERLSGKREQLAFVENGFRYRSKWNIVGTIEHWGHIHQRTNQYDAQFDVQIVDGDWKLTAMEILDQPQGIVKTRLRKF